MYLKKEASTRSKRKRVHYFTVMEKESRVRNDPAFYVEIYAGIVYDK